MVTGPEENRLDIGRVDQQRFVDGTYSFDFLDANSTLTAGAGCHQVAGAANAVACEFPQPGAISRIRLDLGAGNDTLDASYYVHEAPATVVTLDDQANDGQPGEGDNVHAGATADRAGSLSGRCGSPST